MTILAGLAVVVVIAFGLLPDAAGRSGVSAPVAPTATASVTVAPVARQLVVAPGEATVWDLARRAAPEATGPQLAAVAERIVELNSLTSMHLRPGQVLWVPKH